MGTKNGRADRAHAQAMGYRKAGYHVIMTSVAERQIHKWRPLPLIPKSPSSSPSAAAITTPVKTPRKSSSRASGAAERTRLHEAVRQSLEKHQESLAT